MSTLERLVAQIGLVAGYICFVCTLIVSLFLVWMWCKVNFGG